MSTTTKAKARKDRKEGKHDDPGTPAKVAPKDTEMADEGSKEEKKEEVKEPEADFQELKNPSRVLK